MASIRDLKKDMNNVLGDIIDAALVWEMLNPKEDHKEAEAIVEDSIKTFDELIVKVNERKIDDRASHIKKVRKEFAEESEELVKRVNAL